MLFDPHLLLYISMTQSLTQSLNQISSFLKNSVIFSTAK